MKKHPPSVLKQNSGQAIVEYILMLALVLSLLVTITFAFRRMVASLWQTMTCEISAACPTCPPDPDVRNKIGRGCKY